MIRTTIAAKVALDDPLSLADMYRAGLGRHWNSLREGSRELSALNLKASVASLQQAMTVAEFPCEILSLFKDVGLVNRTARELIRARNEHGLDQLKSRATTIDPTGKSRTQLLALLCGDEVTGSMYRGHSKERPLAIDQRFRDGVRLGLWSSVREAEKVLGIDHARLVKAAQIAGLPDEVKALFPAQALTFSLGWQLVQLTKVRGIEAMRKAAILARTAIPRLSQQELMNRFVGLSGYSVDVKVKRAPGGKVVIEFRCDSDDPGAEMHLAMIATWLRDKKPVAK